MSTKTIVLPCLLFMMILFISVKVVSATSFDLIPPTGELQRGQDITFTINIDTEGAALNAIESGLTYDSQLLQYVSVTAGAAMNTVVADTATYGTGKVLFSGTNTTGFNGTGVFATVVFKIIAQSSGSTEICTLWLPTPTPTPGPTSIAPTNTPIPTLPPQPTALPQTGITDSRNTIIVIAFAFIAAAGGVFYLSRKQQYSVPHHTIKKHAAHRPHGKSSSFRAP